MVNLKVFADKQMDRQTSQKLYSPDLSTQGYKNHLWNRRKYCGENTICSNNNTSAFSQKNSIAKNKHGNSNLDF